MDIIAEGLPRRPRVVREATAITLSDLLAAPGVEETIDLRSRVGFLAFHGGLERHTEVVAAAAAEVCGGSLYTIIQPADLGWHVPSHLVSPCESAALAAFLAHVEVAIAVHGYGRVGWPRHILCGGRNRRFAKDIARQLTRRMPGSTVVADLDAIPRELRGLHPSNPVNLPQYGGVQVELPPFGRSDGGIVTALAETASAWLP